MDEHWLDGSLQSRPANALFMYAALVDGKF